MKFYPGFEIEADHEQMTFRYGADVFGPVPEQRHLDAIRKSLMDSNAKGPDVVYSIVMNVGKKEDKTEIDKRHLCYGVVTYAKGQIGKEPIRSQGHIHAISAVCNESTCEVYEIWDGQAVIYMQESGTDDAGNCYAVHAGPGDVVIVPPGWVHATVNADPDSYMTFGAWCIDDYAFEYKEVRAHSGIAFFPIVEDGKLTWIKNEKYHTGTLHTVEASQRPLPSTWSDKPIYTQFEENHDAFDLVYDPKKYDAFWKEFH